MKGIKLCGECADYDWKKHKCKRGKSIEIDPRNKFYDDCPLPDVVEAVLCKDCKYCEYPQSEKEWCKKGHLHGNAETWFCADGERR